MNPDDKHLDELRQVFVFGGCHVTGIGIGDSTPFSKIVADWWGATRVEATGHLTISKALVASQIVAPPNPGALVILQMGHYDAWKNLSLLNPISRKRASKLRSKRSDNGNRKNKIPRNSHIIVYISKYLVGLLGLLSDSLLIKSFQSRSALRRMEKDFESLNYALSENLTNIVVVLSTFPTFSPRANKHRRMLNNIMLASANKFGFLYIDLWQELRSGFCGSDFPWPSSMLDSIHLNSEGHTKVGNYIIEHIARNLSHSK